MKIWLEDRFPPEEKDFELYDGEDFYDALEELEDEPDEDCGEYCGYHPHNVTLSRNEILRTQ